MDEPRKSLLLQTSVDALRRGAASWLLGAGGRMGGVAGKGLLHPVSVFESADAMLAAVGCPLGISRRHVLTRQEAEWLAQARDSGQSGCQGVPAGPGGWEGFPLLGRLLAELAEVRAIKAVHGSCRRARFPVVPRANACVYATGQLLAASETWDGGVQSTIRVIVEAEGESRPLCVVDIVTCFYFASRPAASRRLLRSPVRKPRAIGAGAGFGEATPGLV